MLELERQRERKQIVEEKDDIEAKAKQSQVLIDRLLKEKTDADNEIKRQQKLNQDLNTLYEGLKKKNELLVEKLSKI